VRDLYEVEQRGREKILHTGRSADVVLRIGQQRAPWSRRATPAIAALLALLQKLSR